MDDTTPEARRFLIEGYRRMPGWRKIQQVRTLNRRGTGLALSSIRQRHPDADEREQRLRLASRRIGPDLLRRCFDWDVRVRGY